MNKTSFALLEQFFDNCTSSRMGRRVGSFCLPQLLSHVISDDCRTMQYQLGHRDLWNHRYCRYLCFCYRCKSCNRDGMPSAHFGKQCVSRLSVFAHDRFSYRHVLTVLRVTWFAIFCYDRLGDSRACRCVHPPRAWRSNDSAATVKGAARPAAAM